MATTWIGELLIGEGFWLGLILIISILFLVSYIVPHFSIIGSIICLFLLIYYNENLIGSDLRIWGMVLIGVTPVFLLLTGSKK